MVFHTILYISSKDFGMIDILKQWVTTALLVRDFKVIIYVQRLWCTSDTVCKTYTISFRKSRYTISLSFNAQFLSLLCYVMLKQSWIHLSLKYISALWSKSIFTYKQATLLMLSLIHAQSTSFNLAACLSPFYRVVCIHCQKATYSITSWSILCKLGIHARVLSQVI